MSSYFATVCPLEICCCCCCYCWCHCWPCYTAVAVVVSDVGIVVALVGVGCGGDSWLTGSAHLPYSPSAHCVPCTFRYSISDDVTIISNNEGLAQGWTVPKWRNFKMQWEPDFWKSYCHSLEKIRDETVGHPGERESDSCLSHSPKKRLTFEWPKSLQSEPVPGWLNKLIFVLIATFPTVKQDPDWRQKCHTKDFSRT